MAASFAQVALVLCLSAGPALALQLSGGPDGCEHCVQGTTGDQDGCFYSQKHSACTNAAETHFCKAVGSTFTEPVTSCKGPLPHEPLQLAGSEHRRETTKVKKAAPGRNKAAAEEMRRVAGTGDPHMINNHGEHFDLMQPGKHMLLLVPRDAEPEVTLLNVQADARRVGPNCADLYFKSVNVSGAWVEGQHGPRGLHFFADDMEHKHKETLQFGKFGLKLVWGQTSGGTQYLNVFLSHAKSVKYPLGGLLGEDDHTAAATPSPYCKASVALIGTTAVDRHMDRSHAEIASESETDEADT